MELTKNIFFNTDKLIENSTVKISYTGEFFQDGTEDVFIHFGFGPNWDETSETKMERTELGFQAEVTLTDKETFNFCFKAADDRWDNNYGANYSFPIEKAETELVALEDEPTSLGSAKKLRRTYLWSKKIRLAVYKIITYLPKIISGNYKRKVTNTGTDEK